jgi:hypothetical protein
MLDKYGNLDTDYDLLQGYLIESPLGVLHLFDDEDEIILYNSVDDFKECISNRFPKDFAMVELK